MLNILPVGCWYRSTTPPWRARLRLVAASILIWLREMVGVLGWLDTPLPGIVYQSWNTIVIAVLVLALVRGKWRERVVVIALSALTILIPVILVTRQAKELGVVWPGACCHDLATPPRVPSPDG